MLQALEIDGSNISVQPSSITTDLVSMVTNRLMHLEPADYGFKVTLDRLILYEAGGHYNYHCSPRESGNSVFAYPLHLQITVLHWAFYVLRSIC